MANTFGEISWADDFQGSAKKNSKDLWLRLEKGENYMRIITQPYQYITHKYKKEGDTNPKSFGQKINCSMANGSCPLCALGDKAKPRWLLGVISRKDNTFKILDISYAVFLQIKKLVKNVKYYGDPTKYDINIEVDPNGGATGYYTVQPLPKEPLSASDQKILDEVDLEDLVRRVTPPKPEYVQSRIDKINGNDGTTPVAAPTPVATTPETEEGSEDFPAYDESSNTL
jgi:hypothetical protein